MFLKKSELCLINVYLPHCSRANTDEFLAYLGKLRQLCEELQCPNICYVGDFNAGTTNTFGGLFEDFCMENDFIISDYALQPLDTFTYISDVHNFVDRPFYLILFSASSNAQYGCANRVHNF